jgi:hypothetical protein
MMFISQTPKTLLTSVMSTGSPEFPCKAAAGKYGKTNATYYSRF